MKTTILVCLLVVLAGAVQAQKLMPLWDGQVPNYVKTDETEQHTYRGDLLRIALVQNPEIEVYLPSANMATGQAVVICPGGGYHILAYHHEGTDFAKYLNSKGIAGIVLKYRLPISKSVTVPHQTPLLDAQRAIRMVRYHAKEWHINPEKVGIMGSSAGGHLASTASTHFDLGKADAEDSIDVLSCRPDFSVLLYPVVSFDNEITHKGSKKALLANELENATMVNYYSNEKQVTENTPPAVLIHASNDKVVPVQNSLRYYQALVENGVVAEMHIYPNGGHGFGLATKRGYLSTWPERAIDFIKNL